MVIADGYMDNLSLRVKFKTVMATFTPDSALFGPTKGNAQISCILRVNPDHSTFNGLGKTMAALNVTCPYISSKPIFDVIGHPEHLFLRFKWNYSHDWTKNLFLCHTHFVVAMQK